MSTGFHFILIFLLNAYLFMGVLQTGRSHFPYRCLAILAKHFTHFLHFGLNNGLAVFKKPAHLQKMRLATFVTLIISINCILSFIISSQDQTSQIERYIIFLYRLGLNLDSQVDMFESCKYTCKIYIYIYIYIRDAGMK